MRKSRFAAGQALDDRRGGVTHAGDRTKRLKQHRKRGLRAALRGAHSPG